LGKGISHLLYPNYCIGCNEEVVSEPTSFCVHCLTRVSLSDHFETKDNDLIFRLSARVPLQHGAALFNFIKGGRVQSAIHALKYMNRADIGVAFGKMFGERMQEGGLMTMPDLIIPIPLHYKRQQKRGYNQSEKFAQGISEIISVPVSKKHLTKEREIVSQTGMTREDRFNNVLHSFELTRKEALAGKTVLLVDDVLTTGATIEAAQVLLSEVPGLTLQLGLIALAEG